MSSIEMITIMLLIVCGAVYNMYWRYKKKQYVVELCEVLEREGYDSFCVMLDSKMGRKCYPRYIKKLKKLDAAIYCERYPEAELLMDELDRTMMSSKDYINYNMEVLNYAVSRKDKARGKKACEALRKWGISEKYAWEAEQVYDIYILRNSNHIEELRIFASRVKNPSSKAMAYYRIARQYYYINDMEAFKKYMTMSRNVYEDTVWQRTIQKILDGDYEELNH